MSYYAWVGQLPSAVELLAVQYPGRMERMSEPYAVRMDALADGIAGALLEHVAATGREVVLFGHSMGASVAFEVALRLERARTLRRLVVSGRPGPRLQNGGCVHLADEAGLIGELTRIGATHPELLANAELRELLLPCVRADYRLIETYAPKLSDRVSCPISAFAGDADREAMPDVVESWREATTGPFAASIFEGDHFYLVPAARQVVATVLEHARLTPARVERGASLP